MLLQHLFTIFGVAVEAEAASGPLFGMALKIRATVQYRYLSRALFGMPMKIEADGMAEKATVDS